MMPELAPETSNNDAAQCTTCPACKKDTLAGPWGDLACHGCSIVDRVRTDRHPWRRMLLGLPPPKGRRRRFQGQSRAERNILTPPLLLSTDSLREEPQV